MACYIKYLIYHFRFFSRIISYTNKAHTNGNFYIEHQVVNILFCELGHPFFKIFLPTLKVVTICIFVLNKATFSLKHLLKSEKFSAQKKMMIQQVHQFPKVP